MGNQKVQWWIVFVFGKFEDVTDGMLRPKQREWLIHCDVLGTKEQQLQDEIDNKDARGN
jgi:hypothetical protein